MAKPLRVLLIEDSERDAALLQLYLRRGGFDATVQRVESPILMKVQLQAAEWDVVVCDFNLAGFNAYSALKVLQESGRDIPFIVVSGEISEAIIDGITKAGATDYLAKYEMSKVVPTIERVLKGRAGKS